MAGGTRFAHVTRSVVAGGLHATGHAGCSGCMPSRGNREDVWEGSVGVVDSDLVLQHSDDEA